MMRTLWRALALLLVVTPAWAGTITCTPLADYLPGGGAIAAYEHLAKCLLSNSYATGGDSFGNVGRDVCGSANRLPTAVLVSGFMGIGASPATTARGFSYDATANKIQCWLTGAALSGAFAECGAVDNSATPVILRALCK